MIVSFANNDTEKMFEGVALRRIDLNLQKLALRKLRYIDAAMNLDDLRIPPANRLEKLHGDYNGYFSIRVNDQFRIIFRWRDGNAYEVEFLDYH